MTGMQRNRMREESCAGYICISRPEGASENTQTCLLLLSWPSIAPPPLHRLDQTRHHHSHAWHTSRPCQKQVRTGGRKCTITTATDHPQAPDETSGMHEH